MSKRKFSQNYNFLSTFSMNSARRDVPWGSDFNIERALETYQCTHEENNLRAFDKYLFPKRLHYGTTTQIDTILLLMDRYNKETVLTNIFYRRDDTRKFSQLQIVVDGQIVNQNPENLICKKIIKKSLVKSEKLQVLANSESKRKNMFLNSENQISENQISENQISKNQISKNQISENQIL